MVNHIFIFLIWIPKISDIIVWKPINNLSFIWINLNILNQSCIYAHINDHVNTYQKNYIHWQKTSFSKDSIIKFITYDHGALLNKILNIRPFYKKFQLLLPPPKIFFPFFLFLIKNSTTSPLRKKCQKSNFFLINKCIFQKLRILFIF